MSNPMEINNCPGTLKKGFNTYSMTALNRLFKGRKVSPTLPYESPATNVVTEELFKENKKRLSISGVQEKFSVLLEKNKLRLINEGEQGQYILKPIPNVGTRTDQMPANEHLSMQIARQVFGIETADNGLVFFKNGDPVYITKRFDVQEDGTKLAIEDFATLAGRTPQTHGTDFKYYGNYLQLFELLKKYVPAYPIEAIKLFKLLLFNYLISNGDAHFKNFSLIETALGDFKLSPAYDLLNSRIHIEDRDFALEDGLLPLDKSRGKVTEQFFQLAELAGISKRQYEKAFKSLTTNQAKVLSLIELSYLDEKTKKNYLQGYQTKLKKLLRD
ncbi:type II toxin-antitoxin system HipA family toxin [Arenibacter sp. TNZ]|uniref:type II toxin-antitoxin system HipA family toxin n=1 Tax=Arenibacter TaxID=178469 RepID=UPI000CD4536D|nr:MULTISPECIES: HipA domain-containing protein [Arenibacter]MCM4174130.1 type II toxin-antitoxin system HipA family toxin [Arenibacter sp. TNZ]